MKIPRFHCGYFRLMCARVLRRDRSRVKIPCFRCGYFRLMCARVLRRDRSHVKIPRFRCGYFRLMCVCVLRCDRSRVKIPFRVFVVAISDLVCPCLCWASRFFFDVVRGRRCDRATHDESCKNSAFLLQLFPTDARACVCDVL